MILDELYSDRNYKNKKYYDVQHYPKEKNSTKKKSSKDITTTHFVANRIHHKRALTSKFEPTTNPHLK
jgi:hypothetical protein